MALLTKLKIIGTKVFKHLLRHRFHFEKWHTAVLSERAYALDIIRLCNSKEDRHVFIEIGCGLGDIVFNVHYDERIGYDSSKQVLKAANFLKKLKREPHLHFDYFLFPQSFLLIKSDVIVMVNWIHHIEPVLLKEKLKEYLKVNLKEKGYLIIDTVQDKEYPFNHQITYLTEGLHCKIIKVGDYIRQREVWCLIKD